MCCSNMQQFLIYCVRSRDSLTDSHRTMDSVGCDAVCRVRWEGAALKGSSCNLHPMVCFRHPYFPSSTSASLLIHSLETCNCAHVLARCFSLVIFGFHPLIPIPYLNKSFHWKPTTMFSHCTLELNAELLRSKALWVTGLLHKVVVCSRDVLMMTQCKTFLVREGHILKGGGMERSTSCTPYNTTPPHLHVFIYIDLPKKYCKLFESYTTWF